MLVPVFFPLLFSLERGEGHIIHTHICLITDTCMQKLFDDGHLLSKAVEWLRSDDSLPEVKGSAALVVGNLARTGESRDACAGNMQIFLHMCPFVFSCFSTCFQMF